MLYVYITTQCRRDSRGIGSLATVEALADKLIENQSTQGLQRHPSPFLKKRIGRTRLIIAEVFDGDDVVLCFLRHVYKHEISGDYDAFFAGIPVPGSADPEFAKFLDRARHQPLAVKEWPSELELEYLQQSPSMETGLLTVLESPVWIRSIKEMRETEGKRGLLAPVWELVQKICEDISNQNEVGTESRHTLHPIRLLHRYFPEYGVLFLIEPIEAKTADRNRNLDRSEGEDLLRRSEHFDHTSLLRNAARAYPDFIIYDREIWESTQASLDANLALSPEESDVLSHVTNPATHGGFPLFINGRPGSGKSTVLQYLFAEYLHAHLSRPEQNRLGRPPIYLTYNERLLENAKKLVEDIFTCGARKLASAELVDLSNPEVHKEFSRAFVYFREFLLGMLKSGEFDRKKYVDFYTFRQLYKTLLQRPDAKLRKLAPEVAWHTLRTYIKGKSTGKKEYFDPDSYAELPRDEITVAPETYELVWDKVWNGWYRELCEDENYWDDQDLARRVLDLELVPSEYPGVFCDESQDFTTIELELIFQLSCFTSKQVEAYNLSKIPYAFAGDPFQTLNPTGFRWDAIKATFHENIVLQLDPDRRARIEMTFKELAYNYRSTPRIVRFSNLIQLKRAELFGIPDVSPQRSWLVEEGAHPAYFELELGTQGKLRDQPELVIIVPCQEGEEEAFIQEDEFLKTIAWGQKGEVTRYVLSPMRAKGLEFGRVVLYKFGQNAVSSGHVAVMGKISDTDVPTLKREETLGLEYFFNGTYVGASRAQRRLFVVDTEAGLSQFWGFATDPSEIDALLTEKRRSHWSESEVLHMIRGDASSWAEDRDDPSALANRFFQQGQIERSTYLLQLARTQFSALGNQEKAARCFAQISDIEGNFEAAAECFEGLGELFDAIRCYWEAKLYEPLIRAASRDSSRFDRGPLVLAAKFLLGERDANAALAFLRSLGEADRADLSRQMKCSHWPEVLQDAIAVVAGDLGIPVDLESAKEIARITHRLESEFGIKLIPSLQLSFLAFSANDDVTAISIWEKDNRRRSGREPEYILRAKARTTAYPGSLSWLAKLNDHESIVDEFSSNKEADLDEEGYRIVLSALLELEKYPLIIALMKDGGPWGAIRNVIGRLPVNTAGASYARELVPALIASGIRQQEFRKVMEDFWPGKTDLPVIDKLLENPKLLLACQALIIRRLATDPNLSAQLKDAKFISGRILSIARRDAADLRDVVPMEMVGAALERAGRMDNALAFYEFVFQHRGWGADREQERNAKSRWLWCKKQQANLDQKDPKKRDARLEEAKNRSVDWGVPIPETRYPTVPPLLEERISELFYQESTELPQSDETSGGDAFELHDAGLGGASPFGTETNAGELAIDKGEPPPSDGRLTGAISLESRPAFGGCINQVIDLDHVKLKAVLLTSKRRVEIRDSVSNDLVMIYGKDQQAESRDLELIESGENLWALPLWKLTVSLVFITVSMSLIDVWDDEGRRVFCMVI